MPYTDVFSFLRPKGSLSDEKWGELLEARKSRMMRNIKEIGQMKLRDIPVWQCHPAVLKLCSSFTQGRHLNTRGVFTWDGNTSFQTRHDRIITNVYGFNQSGQWLLAHAEAFPEKPDRGRIYFVESRPSSWKEYGVQPKEVFSQLSRAVSEHVQRRKRLLEDAEELYWQTEMENRALGLAN